MKKLIQTVVGAAVFATATCGAYAAPIGSLVVTTPGSTYDTSALTGFATNGALMVGTVVTVMFADSTTDSATWAVTGGASGAAVGVGWSLEEAGDTFSSPWTLKNFGSKNIAGFSVNGVPGNTIFDAITDPSDSPGSARGGAISAVNGPSSVTFATATYGNRLTVAGIFYGDLYMGLNVIFAGTLGHDSFLTFVSDTDNAKFNITPGVPEPSTYLLMVAGLIFVVSTVSSRSVCNRNRSDQSC